MKLAIIADIHGNLPALEAVLSGAPPVDAWICAGDVVGYYPDVNEVCDILRRLPAFVIRGNHDAYVSGASKPNPQRVAVYQTEWTQNHLEPRHRAWISALPVEINFTFGSKQIKVRHASPWDEETYLYPDSARLSEVQLAPGQVLVLGHTHHPMCVHAGEGIVINPGSVGQPRDYLPAASYAVFDTASGVVEHRRAAYDVAAYQEHLRSLGWPDQTITILSRTR